MNPSLRRFALCAALLISAGAAAAPPRDPYEAPRRQMVEAIENTHRDLVDYTGHPGFAPRTLAVLGEVPRQAFVRESDLAHAYDNTPLPIGHGQTISQPYIVALMTDLLQVKPGDDVLEIGTGSGYQAGVLSRLAAHVYSIEIVPPLGERAAGVLERLGYHNVEVKVADGYYGWPEHAPFDAVIVTAASSNIPPPLVQQLKPGGRMVIPIGTSFMTQQLVLVEKDAEGGVTNRQILPVRFVPLTGGH